MNQRVAGNVAARSRLRKSAAGSTPMPIETEIKLRVESHEPTRARLHALGAQFIRRGMETNRIFDLSDGALRRKGMGLRVRTLHDEATGERSATLTAKGPRTHGVVKSREECEVSVADPDATVDILHLLGYAQILRYEKRRETWSHEDCLIELDEPARLGLFVEIEGPDAAAIAAVRKALGLAGASDVEASYVHMMMDYCHSHHITNRRVFFDQNLA